MRNFETMTWSQILGQRHHSIPTERLCSKAKKRLKEIEQDDVEEVVSLAFSGKERLIGIRCVSKDLI